MATVGERVKKARKAEKLNQTQLSKKAGIAQSTLWALERGHNTTTKAIVALAIALRRRPQWLQHGTPPELVSEGDWPFSTSRRDYDKLTDKAKNKIDEYIAEQVALEGHPTSRKSDGLAA